MTLSLLCTISRFEPVHRRCFCSVKATTKFIAGLAMEPSKTAPLLRWRNAFQSGLCVQEVKPARPRFGASACRKWWQHTLSFNSMVLIATLFWATAPGIFGVGPLVPDVLMDGMLLHIAPNGCRWTWQATAVLHFTNMQQPLALSHYYYHHRRRRPHSRPSQCAVFWRSRQ